MINWYRSFRKKYVVQQRREHEYLANKYYAHLIDPFLTKLAYDLKLTPNVVTGLSGICGVIAGIMFALDFLVIGALLLQLHHFIDGADGNLARLTNRCTPLGAKLDRVFDQIVRISVFVGVAYITDVSLWLKIGFISTIYLDILIVHTYVLPFMRKYGVIRAEWKAWFLSKGIIPSFDIFLIYFLTSAFALFDRLDLLIYVVIVGKNLDWIYRVWECKKTKWLWNL